MKKVLTLLLMFLLITGCSKIKDNSFDNIIDSILYQDTKLANNNFDGYKFYLPRGLKVYNKNDSNIEIKDSNNTYYLYVDMISYYYKTKKDAQDAHEAIRPTYLNVLPSEIKEKYSYDQYKLYKLI